MKNILNSLFVLVAFTFFCIAVRGSIENHNFHMSTVSHDDPMFLDEIVELSEPQKVAPPIVPEIRLASYRTYTYRDQQILEGIARAEAGNQGVEGMLLVMNVVMNRCEKTGQSIEQVVYSPNQFYTRGMCSGNDESFKAFMLLMDGVDYSQGAIYFAAGGYNQYGKPLFRFRDHYFSK